VRLAFTCLLLSSLLRAQDSTLKIVVIDGQDALINVNQPVAHDPAIEVRDAANAPLPNVSVTFFLPSQGPGGVFANGTNTMTATTDQAGRAVARGIRYNKQTGKFEIRAIASHNGQTATAIITQTSVAGISTSGGGGSKKIWILLVAGAAAAGIGAIVATRGGSGSSSSNSGPITITAGTPTVGGPH